MCEARCGGERERLLASAGHGHRLASRAPRHHHQRCQLGGGVFGGQHVAVAVAVVRAAVRHAAGHGSLVAALKEAASATPVRLAVRRAPGDGALAAGQLLAAVPATVRDAVNAGYCRALAVVHLAAASACVCPVPTRPQGVSPQRRHPSNTARARRSQYRTPAVVHAIASSFSSKPTPRRFGFQGEWRAAERRHSTGRGSKGSPPCRHFKNQSCCCLGSAFEVAAFQTTCVLRETTHHRARCSARQPPVGLLRVWNQRRVVHESE
jgi:hypothetical protein